MKSDTLPNFYDLTACPKHHSFQYHESNDLCLDKSIVECHMSEILIRRKEDIYHVKDIWVDEVIPVQNKSSGTDFCNKESVKQKIGTLNNGTEEVERQPDNHGVIKCSSMDFSEKQGIKDDELTAKMLKSDKWKLPTREFDSEISIVTQDCKKVATVNMTAKERNMSILDVSESLKDDNSYKHLSFQPDYENEDDDDVLVKESLTLGDIFLMEKKDACLHNRNRLRDEQISQNLDGNGSSGSFALVDLSIRGEEESSATRPDSCGESEKSNTETVEEHRSDDKKTNLPFLSSVSTSQETSEIRKYNTETGGASSSCKCENHEQSGSYNLETEHPDPWIIGTKIHHPLEASNDGTFSDRFRSSIGEASFPATEPVSGLIIYSGPIAYSGSLSMRSDSSTTSGRSFAFPVLQNEWNSSPVRMAKPDRRHLQRHKGWIERVTCCRF